MRPVIRAATVWRDRTRPALSCCLFGRRHLLLEPSCSRHGVPRCCLPAGGRSCRTMTGFPRFTRPSCVRCRVPPLPRGRGALLTVLPKTASTAASQRPAHIPQKTLPSPGLLFTRLPSGVHVVHPSGLPLTCNQRMDHRPLGFLPELHTPQRRQSVAHARSGDGR